MDPTELEALAKRVENLREGLLFDERVKDDSMDLEAVQIFLLALSQLEAAQRYLSLAALKQARALGDARLAVYR